MRKITESCNKPKRKDLEAAGYYAPYVPSYMEKKLVYNEIKKIYGKDYADLLLSENEIMKMKKEIEECKTW